MALVLCALLVIMLGAVTVAPGSVAKGQGVGETGKNTPPSVSFGDVRASSLPGETVVLTAQTVDLDGDILAYAASWGDGASSSGTTAPGGGDVVLRHPFAIIGTYEATISVDDGRRGLATASTSLRVAEAAFLRVTTNPPVPGKIFVDGVPRDEWGLTWLKIGPGTRVVSFGPVVGMGTPDPIAVDLTTGVTTDVVGEYRSHGSLRVTTEPALPATIFIDDVPANDWGVWRSIPPGTYTVSFGRVPGYDPPAPRTVVVEGSASVHVPGVYTLNPDAIGEDPSMFGYLRVTTSNTFGEAVGSQVLVDDIPRDEWGLAWMKITPGSHKVSFSEVYRNLPPENTTVSVTAQTATTYDGVFSLDGLLRVIVSPELPSTIYVDGVPRDDWGMFQTLPPGVYSVSFGEVPGYEGPPPVLIDLRAGEFIQILGSFVHATATDRTRGHADAVTPETRTSR